MKTVYRLADATRSFHCGFCNGRLHSNLSTGEFCPPAGLEVVMKGYEDGLAAL